MSIHSVNASPIKFSFKDDRKSINIPGTKKICIKDQQVLSSGITSLDDVLGGGLQLGTILLVEEDEFGVFSKHLTKFFLAEGINCKHCLFLSSLDSDTRKLVYELPSMAAVEGVGEGERDSIPGGQLTIAWRYQDTPMPESVPHHHRLDLTQMWPRETVDNTEITHWPPSWPLPHGHEDPYTELLCALQERVLRQGHSAQAAQPRRTALRLAVHRLGSALWPQADAHLPGFLYCLRRIVQSAYATAVVTLPTSLLKPETVMQCEHLSDNVIRLQSLGDSASPLYSDYSGLLNVVKLATINSLASYVPQTKDWAFKLRKRGFIIEKLHLPPELQDSTQREQDDSSAFSCATSKSASLDF